MILTLLTKRYPGFRAWFVQRFTGLMMAIFSVVLLVRLICLVPQGFDAWHAFFAPIWWRILCVLFWVSLSIHAWLGVRDVFKDYVPNITVRKNGLRLSLTLIWLYLVWAIWLMCNI